MRVCWNFLILGVRGTRSGREAGARGNDASYVLMEILPRHDKAGQYFIGRFADY